jgi:hypothetical protein
MAGPTKFNRNYTVQQEVANATIALTRNIITQNVKTLVLNSILPLTTLTDDAQSAIDAGQIGIQNSLLGLPLWDSITFTYSSGSTLTAVSGQISAINPTISAVLPICILDITQTRNIVKTPVQGLDGTIKEYISDGDYLINIKASLVGDAIDYYPAEAVQSILAICQIKYPVTVLSTILNKYFNISSLVITDYNFTQQEVGMRNVQIIELTCISDAPQNYQIIVQGNI